MHGKEQSHVYFGQLMLRRGCGCSSLQTPACVSERTDCGRFMSSVSFVESEHLLAARSINKLPKGIHARRTFAFSAFVEEHDFTEFHYSFSVFLIFLSEHTFEDKAEAGGKY